MKIIYKIAAFIMISLIFIFFGIHLYYFFFKKINDSLSGIITAYATALLAVVGYFTFKDVRANYLETIEPFVITYFSFYFEGDPSATLCLTVKNIGKTEAKNVHLTCLNKKLAYSKEWLQEMGPETMAKIPPLDQHVLFTTGIFLAPDEEKSIFFDLVNSIELSEDPIFEFEVKYSGIKKKVRSKVKLNATEGKWFATKPYLESILFKTNQNLSNIDTSLKMISKMDFYQNRYRKKKELINNRKTLRALSIISWPAPLKNILMKLPFFKNENSDQFH